MPIGDIEAMCLEATAWMPTLQFRWVQAEGGSHVQLERQYERVTGERRWVPVPRVSPDRLKVQ